MTLRTVREAERVWVCDGCGAEASEWRDWLSVSGTWSTSKGADSFHAHFCSACVAKAGAFLFPLSERNRSAVVPALFSRS